MQLTDLDSGSRVIGDERDYDMPEPDHPWAHLWTAEARAEMRKLLNEGARLSRFAKGTHCNLSTSIRVIVIKSQDFVPIIYSISHT